MVRIFPSTRKIFNVVVDSGAAAAGFIASQVKPGFLMTNRVRLIGGTVAPAIQTGLAQVSNLGSPTLMAIKSSLVGTTGSSIKYVNAAPKFYIAPGDLGRFPVRVAGWTSQGIRSARLTEIVRPAFVISKSPFVTIGSVVKPAALIGRAPGNLNQPIKVNSALFTVQGLRSILLSETIRPSLLASRSPSNLVAGERALVAGFISRAPGNLRFLKTALMAGAFSRAPSVLIISETGKPAFLTSRLGFTGDARRTASNLASKMSPSPSSAVVIEKDIPAGKIVQIKYDLSGNRNATAVSAAANGTSTQFGNTNYAWPSPTNAQGSPNGTLATLSCDTGIGGSARISQLNCTPGTFNNKTALTIQSVTLTITISSTSQLLANADIYFRVMKGSTTLATLDKTNTSLSGTTVIDLTSAVDGNWANLPDLVEIEGRVAPLLTGGTNINVDGMVLNVTATNTQAV